METELEFRNRLKRDIMTYLGDGLASIELTSNQLELAVDLGLDGGGTEGAMRMRGIAHGLVMLGMARSKFSTLEVPGGNISLNGPQLIEMGKYYLNNT